MDIRSKHLSSEERGVILAEHSNAKCSPGSVNIGSDIAACRNFSSVARSQEKRAWNSKDRGHE